MRKGITYICKKCGDIFSETDYKHYAVCQDTNIIDPEDVYESYKVEMNFKKKETGS